MSRKQRRRSAARVGRPDRPTQKQLDRFLHHFSQLGSVIDAAQRAGLHRNTLYAWRARDFEFAGRWEEARRLGRELLEDEAMHRALRPVDRTVWRNGRRFSSVQQYDSGMLKFLLRAHQPQVYGERRDGAPAWSFDVVRRLAAGKHFISQQLIDASMSREMPGDAHDGAPLVMGVDPARFGRDRSAIVLRRGLDARTQGIEGHSGLDLMTLARRVAEIARERAVQVIYVDEPGVGGGLVDRLREMGVAGVVGINFGAAAARFDAAGAKPPYANKRAEIWGSLQQWLLDGGVLPPHDELRADLCGVQWDFTERGEIQLEQKDSMRRRGLRSPDFGDALALTFA